MSVNPNKRPLETAQRSAPGPSLAGAPTGAQPLFSTTGPHQNNTVHPTSRISNNTNTHNTPVGVIEVSSGNEDSDDEPLLKKRSPASSTSSASSAASPSSPEKKKKQRVKKVNGKWVFPEFTREETSSARRYLKKQGPVPFLEKYLPTNSRPADLLYIIALLGFNSMKLSNELTDENGDEEKNLKYICSLLKKAMDKVFASRSRIGTLSTVNDALELIKNAKRILVLTGAGISTSLGIPDFRSARGIYANLPDLQLDDPQEVFDLNVFRENPGIFFSVAHMILPPADAYTPLHAFIKLLHDKGKLLRNYTQNIDNLEENVGLPADKIIQCHGSFSRATCQSCQYEFKGSLVAKYIRNQEIPICKFCGKERKKRFEKNPNYHPQSFGVVKPNITFFGEGLPQKFHDNLKSDVANCDLLLCIGTSLKVAPVSDIVNEIPPEVPQILINKDMINHTEFDVSFLGYCDDVASYLCNKLGWNIEHPNFKKIVDGALELETLDTEVGIHKVTGFWKNNDEIDNKMAEEKAKANDTVPETQIE